MPTLVMGMFSLFPRSSVETQFSDARNAAKVLTNVESRTCTGGRRSVQQLHSHAGAWERVGLFERYCI